MKKDKLTKTITILTVTTAAITLVSAASDFLMPMYISRKLHIDTGKVSSIGIIGGADGPTAIYLTDRPSSHLITVIFASLTLAGIVYRIIARRSNET